MKPRRVKPAAPTAHDDLRAFIGIRRVNTRTRDSAPGIVPEKSILPVVVHLGGSNWGVNVPRLHEIEDALFRGTPIDDAMREELRAIAAVVGYEQEAQLAAPANRRPDRERFRRAALVLALRDRGRTLKEALFAVIPFGTNKDRDNLAKAQRELKASGKAYRVLEWQVCEALDRLTPLRNRK
jgi:hypothetical protein